ncbi:hypothetical protein ACHAXT_004280 [Thalassiosira profunda]
MDDIEESGDAANVLKTAIEGVLPEGSTITIVTIGGVSVSRRRLRFLQESGSEIVVQFEMAASKDCSAATCDASEAAELSIELDRELTEALESSVESGELTVEVQMEAETNGDLTLSNATVSAVEVGEAEVTVTDAEEGQVPDSSKDSNRTWPQAGWLGRPGTLQTLYGVGTYGMLAVAVFVCMAATTTCFSPPSPSLAASSRHLNNNPLRMSPVGGSDSGQSPAQKRQEQQMEMASIQGAEAIAKLDVQERTKRAMLAEAVEDRIFELVDELEELVKRNNGLENLSDEIKEEATEMAKQTKALQIQYDDLVSGRPSHLLDL